MTSKTIHNQFSNILQVTPEWYFQQILHNAEYKA